MQSEWFQEHVLESMDEVQDCCKGRVEPESEVILWGDAALQLENADAEKKLLVPESLADSCIIVQVVLKCSSNFTLSSKL